MWLKERIETIYNLKGLENFASLIRNKYWNDDFSIFFFYGPMAAGKTQLIHYILYPLLNKQNSVTSPTFSLLNIYKGINDADYLHFDLYRKDFITMEQLEILGFNTLYENKNNKCFIEWPERITNIHKIPGIHIKISLDQLDQEKRYINMEVR